MALIYANQILKHPKLEPRLKQALEFYYIQVANNMDFTDWGFEKGQHVYTHTIAYTLRGFYESGILLKDGKYTQLVIDFLDFLVNDYSKTGKLAGAYTANKKANHAFRCLTGNAQLSLLFSKLYQESGNEDYLDMAKVHLLPVLKAQLLRGPKGIKGGIPGSNPIWGPYQSWRIPNWGMKFFLDAYILLQQISTSSL